METPLLIVNFKTYEKGSGENAEELAIQAEKVARQEDAEVAVAVQNADIDRVSDKAEIPVLAQHLDPEGYGSNTGSDVAETLAFNGASGTLINHSEDQVSIDTIEEDVERAEDAGLETVVCIDDPEMAERVSDYDPDFIAFEPPELIGGEVSVSDAKPGLVREAVENSSVDVLTGAGVKSREDVEAALDIGTEGVLVASGVAKADDPEEAMRGLVSGF
ncbi:MAG: triose-phosphate isomerase [Candidatus Nanohaloarchaea archaeon]|nr:triose-phosphate isomerase [Candidatus Nanohaloarchaea archaeon]